MLYDKWKLTSPTLLAKMLEILGEDARIEKHDTRSEVVKNSNDHMGCSFQVFYRIINKVLGKNLIAATWYQNQLSGCCGVQVYSHFRLTYGFPTIPRKGLATLQNSIAIHIAKEEGFTKLLATEIISGHSYKHQEHSLKVFENNGWRRVEEFVNPRTQNNLAMFIKDLI